MNNGKKGGDWTKVDRRAMPGVLSRHVTCYIPAKPKLVSGTPLAWFVVIATAVAVVAVVAWLSLVPDTS